MDPFTLGFVALQVGVSLFNQWKNSELTTRIKEEQRKAKLDEIKNNQRRDMERFMRNCQLQEEFEAQSHINKMQKYRQDFLNSLIKMAHKENLDNHYHLNVSPYVIQRSLIPLTTEDLKNTRQELFCILTGSNNKIFNEQVLPYLDESICDLISKYWNESSNHTICYYQNLWDSKDSLFSNEDVENMKSLINTPTISLSPLFQKDNEGFQLVIKVSAWGMGNQDSISCELPTEVRFQSLPNKYSLSEISEVIDNVIHQAICAIGQLADVFYWVNYYQAPLLPMLIGMNKIQVPDDLAIQYALAYSDFYKNLVIGNNIETRELSPVLADSAEINQYYHPERSLTCLKSIMALTGKSDTTSEIIERTMLSFCSAWTDEQPKSLAQIDSSLLHYQNINLILKLIEYAKSIDNSQQVKELLEIIRGYVMSWRYSVS